jgi:hypothetical protein
MEKDIYAMIDEFLTRLTKDHLGVYHGFPYHETKTKNALSIIQDYRLAIFRGDPKSSNADITPQGEKVVNEWGGVENYINSLNKKAEAKDDLEFTKLKGEVEKLRYDISISKDTPKNNRINRTIAIISIIFAFISLIISAIALMRK